MTEWHQGFRKQIEYCAYCPKLCRFACPVAQVECSETVTPTAKQTVLKLVRDGVLAFDEKVGELVYLCSGCLITRTYCEHDIAVYPTLEAARIEAVKTGTAPETARAYAQKWARRQNPFNLDTAKVMTRHVPEKYLRGNAAAVLFAGCTTMNYFPEQITDTVKVLEVMGLDFRVYQQNDSICCGWPLLTMGHQDAFLARAEKLAHALKHAELLVSPCPACAHVLKTRYAEFGLAIKAEVKHVAELVADSLDRLPVRSRERRKLIYHDPCVLGRYLGVYEEPRKILEAAAGHAPLEFSENREHGTCCGGGAGLPVTRPATARAIAREKVAAVSGYGAEVITTACPMCRRMLGRAGQDGNIAADDVVSILCRAMQA